MSIIKILILPDFLGTTTMPEHHSVGDVTGEITPVSSISFNCLITSVCWGKGTRRGVDKQNGLKSCLILIEYSSPNFPSPWNKDGNLSLYFETLPLPTLFTMWTKFRAWIAAGHPKRGWDKLFKTKMSWYEDNPLWVIFELNFPLTLTSTPLPVLRFCCDKLFWRDQFCHNWSK